MRIHQSSQFEFEWNVIYTYPNFEKKITSALNRHGITCFLPLHKTIRQWSDRKKKLELPLFPNYVFVYTNQLNKYEVLDVPGVTRYISFEGAPVAISPDEIDIIKKMIEEPCVRVEQDDFIEGDSVVIMEGPFTGLRGILLERKGKSRFAIKISAINQVLSVEVSSFLVKKVLEKVLI